MGLAPFVAGMKQVQILGTRGIPARHGGFETFAEKLALYLVSRHWEVTVYCQAEAGSASKTERWQGIELVHIPAPGGSLGTIVFDLRATWHAMGKDGVALVLGYNTAIFNVLLKIAGKKVITNMDGIEWKRKKWGSLAKAWFYANEHFGRIFSDVLVADHPAIKEHLERIPTYKKIFKRKVVTIPYGADLPLVESDELRWLAKYGVQKPYCLLVARPEPENSILEIVEGFCRKQRNHYLVILGEYDRGNTYHKQVLAAANQEVVFTGAIYDKQAISSLRKNAMFYIHGHTVGGTNPALVEALAAGMAVLAQNNPFNRWVAGDAAVYFDDANEASEHIDKLLSDEQMRTSMKKNANKRYSSEFRWESVLEAYEKVLQ